MHGASATAFWITGTGAGELREEPLSPPGPDEVQIRTLYTGVSRGTEALVWQGQIPATEYERMRSPFQAGDFPAPVKYGYCNVGVIEKGPREWVGKEVFCLYPHQSRYNAPIKAVQPLPSGLPPERAVLTANTETALNACWDAAPLPGERITVIGAGVVGALTAALCAAVPGTEVQLIDTNPARQFLAAKLGVSFCTPENAENHADRVIHASGSESGLQLALSLAGPEASIIELSWYGSKTVSLPLGGAFHSQRLTLKSSQVGQLPPSMRPRWDYARRLAKAMELLTAHPAWEALIDGETRFENLPHHFADIISGGGLCHRIRYKE